MPSQGVVCQMQLASEQDCCCRRRYELSIAPGADLENGEAQGEVLYRFARCKQPLPMGLMQKTGLPLPESELEVLEPALQWEQLRVCAVANCPLVFPSQACLR